MIEKEIKQKIIKEINSVREDVNDNWRGRNRRKGAIEALNAVEKLIEDLRLK